MKGIEDGISRQWVNGNEGPLQSQMIEGAGAEWIRTKGCCE